MAFERVKLYKISWFIPYKSPSLPAGAGRCVTPAWRAGWAPAARPCPAWSQLGAGNQLIPPTTTTHCPPTTTSGWRGEEGGTGPPPPCPRRSHTKPWRLGWTVSSRHLLFFLLSIRKQKQIHLELTIFLTFRRFDKWIQYKKLDCNITLQCAYTL